MLRIAICDDQPDQLALIRAVVQRYFSDRPDCNIQIDLFDHSLCFLEHLDKTGSYDIALLDICMPGILGTEVAREIRKRGDKTEIVFLTTSDEFAVDAFALKAAHYLIKPFTQKEFDEAMNRVMGRFSSGVSKQLTLKTAGGELRSVEISEIQYIESCAHGQTVHIREGELMESRRSLSRLLEELEELSPGQFIAPYKGYLVNQKAIATIEPKRILLRCGAEIPIPRGSFREIQTRYFCYQFRPYP